MALLPTAVLFAAVFIAAAGGSCQPSIDIESVTATSANVSWSAGCTVDRGYVFRWRLEGPCSTSALQGRTLDPSVTSYFLTGLEVYSQYFTYVDALFTNPPDLARASERISFTTRQGETLCMTCCIPRRVSLISRVRCTLHSAEPASKAPSFLNASHVNSTTVLVTWGGITCSHQNGNISLFELDITLAGRSWRVRVGGDADEGGRFVLTGLQPEGVYGLRVAAVNSDNQTGVFTSITTIQTMETGMLFICT